MKNTVVAAVLGAALALPALAGARTDRELTYRENEIWQAAIRFLRVDSGYKILEKDKDAGYVLFEYKDGPKSHTASLEMVRTVRENKVFVRARLQIEGQPRYVEAVLFDRFVRKLRDEYGDPPPPQLLVQPAPKPAPGGDAGAGGQKPAPGGKSAADGVEDPEDKSEDELEMTDEDLENAGEEK